MLRMLMYVFCKIWMILRLLDAVLEVIWIYERIMSKHAKGHSKSVYLDLDLACGHLSLNLFFVFLKSSGMIKIASFSNVKGSFKNLDKGVRKDAKNRPEKGREDCYKQIKLQIYCMANLQQDSLDQQLYQNQPGYSQLGPNELHKQNNILKQFYKMELDDLVRQKNQQKRAERQKQQRQRNAYNQRWVEGVEAQKMKDISYRNYYQMLVNNQQFVAKGYVNPSFERNSEKDKLIANGIEVDKRRSQLWQEQEQRRSEEMKKNYRELLADQINEKYTRNAVDKEIKIKQQQIYKNTTYTPQELAKLDRQRKLMEMNKYKQDLDTSSPNLASSRERSRTGPTAKNDFNVSQLEDRHNTLVNPLPYTIQNPYILKQMQRKLIESGYSQAF